MANQLIRKGSKGLITKNGAEVYFSPMLSCQDISPFCIEGTSYILIEFHPQFCPFGLEETLYQLQLSGYTPIIAHVERYSYVRKKPELLHSWVNKGWVIQIDAESLLKGYRQRRQVVHWIRLGLIHIVASDIHSRETNKHCLKKAMEIIQVKCGLETAQALAANAIQIFNGEPIKN